MSQKSKYTPELGEAICRRLSEGKSLLAACKELNVPHRTARQWEKDVPEHGTNATRARELGCHALADQMLEISNTPQIGEIRIVKADGGMETRQEDMLAHRRLQIDTRKWLISRWLPKIYGDRTTLAGDPDAPLGRELTDEQLAARIEALKAKVGGANKG